MAENNDIKNLLGKRIKEIRIARGLTQEYLAEQIGIGQRNLSKIECGNNFVTSETLTKILKVLNIKARDLFDFEHNQDRHKLKEELLKAIADESVDIELLYRFYEVIRK